MDNVEERVPLIEGKISFSTRYAYALGHIFNDLAAAMWFSYTLLFLQRVSLLDPIVAGSLLLLGQIVDALMTPVFGILVDKYAKKKIWHVIGSIMVTFSFPIIFGSFVNPRNPTTMMTLSVISIIVFQTGWAAVQISHLSMIPALTNSPIVRADLTAIRYSAQVGAAVLVFIVTWVLLPNSEDSVVRLGVQDAGKFRNIVLVLTIIGIAATIFFHIFLKARLLEDTSSKVNNDHISRFNSSSNRRRSWIGTSILLRVALLYVASRLFLTLATVYLPLFIEEIDVGGKQALATVPLVSYLSSFMSSLLLKYMNRSCGTKVCYLLGALIGILAAIVIEFAGSNAAVMYSVAILIGAGSSITMVTALSVTAELIGSRTDRSAFVYSIVTFLDKVVTGLVVILIEKWRCQQKELCPTYNRDTLSIVCASSMLLGLITLVTITRCFT
ncbi:major facilitator superfamily domain-containing protein 12-like [Belonocnema kinseyi]|uniref:major facilitator superfamily domain-containing protein 12-like n=1 Tax=Belonocnema kinseyi TaxID=2817044 RepID=UPI00143D94D5|nr:major facilitator superfamily domain-containing protein 12-like [Belonocnema kinseyi]XP_033222433.1 major facilitator superfamily domain-containing protein 12-like [Belonocnema kinseyi]XP_033222434.1 major facilitator superfamily domain-containing protein 12-like [Belonocnema kinseyi]XP_033222435.1 major facilitator superfamily domain-containing protein 12-like [Belonocnema kinseyi]XP_033222436.1 major facilitator superfamily domain-containing protein 12-like [Belonocnema kinseyi]XP_0332224